MPWCQGHCCWTPCWGSGSGPLLDQACPSARLSTCLSSSSPGPTFSDQLVCSHLPLGCLWRCPQALTHPLPLYQSIFNPNQMQQLSQKGQWDRGRQEEQMIQTIFFIFSTHNTSDTKCMGDLPISTKSPTLQTPAGCPTIQFISDTDYPEWAWTPQVNGITLQDCTPPPTPDAGISPRLSPIFNDWL